MLKDEVTNVHKLAPAAEHGTLGANTQDIIDLLGGCFLLQQRKLSNEGWLEILTRVLNCDAALCARWTRGNSLYHVTSVFGDFTDEPADWKSHTDLVVRASSRREAGFIEDFIEQTAEPSAHQPAFAASHTIEAILDWEPAVIVILMLRDKGRPAWTTADRDYIRYLCSHLRESALVHKKLDQQRYINGLANDILNSWPRGIIALSEYGVIEMANSRAEEILARNNGIGRLHGKLAIDDRRPAEMLNQHLAGLASMTSDGLPDIDSNIAVRKRGGGPDYQLILSSIKLREWNIESRASDRVAIAYLQDPADTTAPSINQLQSFYGMTKAQCRISRALYSGKSVSETADSLNVSINTVRTHLRQIYAKTGARTQAELLGLLTSGLKTFRKNIDETSQD
jgi:DNA-binding CsgD family transcriptional regulator/PAS domain-containing protein